MADGSSVKSKRHWRRWAIAVAALLLVAGAFIAWDEHRRDLRRQSLAKEVIRAGGVVEQPKSLFESLRLARKIGEFPRRQTVATLTSSTINNQWIREHDYLKDFDFWFLQCDSITGDDLAKLIDAHPVEILNARDIVLTDEVLRAIRDKSSLKQALFGKSKYTDEQLAGLPLERLDTLSVTYCGVTAEGLLQTRRCRNLNSISLDASQVTSETAEVLASLGTLEEVAIWGPEVTDEHLEHLHRITSLRKVSVFGTNATDDGRAALAAALPNCKVELKPWRNE
jgi:hypothetical protein